MSSSNKRGLIATFIFVVTLWLLAGLLPTLRAQQQPRQIRLTPALFLARVATNEAGWDPAETGDLYMIHECFLRGAEHQGISYLSYAVHYSQRVAGIRPTTSGRIAWTMNLRPDGREPTNWPRLVTERAPTGSGPVTVRPHPPWSRYRDAWLRTLAAAEEAITTLTLDDVDEWGVCDGPVHDWGSPRLDHARALRLGLVPVDCGVAGGSTANEGWARPSRLPAVNVPEVVIEVD
jgi:hypothetical protein